MSSNGWRVFDAAEYIKFQNKLLAKKGSEDQIQFLKNLRTEQLFLDYMNKAINTDNEKNLYSALSEKPFTEKQFVSPPFDTEVEIYAHWKNLTLSIASRMNFWARATVDLVEAGCIKPSYLVGDQKLDEVLKLIGGAAKKIDADKAKIVDDCVREGLRRMSGLHGRGNRTIFVDCRLARAWWRMHLFHRVESATGVSALTLGKALCPYRASYWVEFMSAVVSRNPVFGNEVVQNAFVMGLFKLLPNSSEHHLGPNGFPTAKRIGAACQEVCVIGGAVELPILEESSVYKLIQVVIQKQQGMPEVD